MPSSKNCPELFNDFELVFNMISDCLFMYIDTEVEY